MLNAQTVRFKTRDKDGEESVWAGNEKAKATERERDGLKRDTPLRKGPAVYEGLGGDLKSFCWMSEGEMSGQSMSHSSDLTRAFNRLLEGNFLQYEVCV